MSKDVWGMTDNEMRDCGEIQTMSHIVNSCPMTKLDGGLQCLHCTYCRRCCRLPDVMWHPNAATTTTADLRVHRRWNVSKKWISRRHWRRRREGIQFLNRLGPGERQKLSNWACERGVCRTISGNQSWCITNLITLSDGKSTFVKLVSLVGPKSGVAHISSKGVRLWKCLTNVIRHHAVIYCHLPHSLSVPLIFLSTLLYRRRSKCLRLRSGFASLSSATLLFNFTHQEQTNKNPV